MSIGFTDRTGIPQRTAEEGRKPVIVFARRIDNAGKRDAILVCERGTGVTAWLPKSQIKTEAGGFGLGELGEMLRITMPLWLAEEKGLLAIAGPGQKTLF